MMMVLFVLIILLALLLVIALTAPKKTSAVARLKRFISEKQENGEKEFDFSSRFRLFYKVSSMLGNVVFISNYREKLTAKLGQAGIAMKGSEFILMDIIITVFFACLGMIFTRIISGGILIGAISAVLPYAYVMYLRSKRIKAFNNQLVDSLVLMTNSLRAGYSFLQAIETVARESVPPISEEFERIMKENNLGVSIETALDNFSKRMENDDVDLIVTAVMINREIGGNLAEIFDNIAETIRERIRIKGEIKTLTAQGRMSGTIVGSLPFVLGAIIFVRNPDFMKLMFDEPLGRMMLLTAGAMMGIGIFSIYKIVNIKV